MCACPWRTFFFSRRFVFLALGLAMLRRAPFLLLLRGLLLPGDRLLRALPRPRVRVRPLAPDRQRAPVADALVATDLDLALDILGDLAAEIAFDVEVAVHGLADLQALVFGQVADLGPAVDLGAADDLVRARRADPVDVSQCDVEPLVPREVDAGDPCHDPEAPS